MKLELLTELLAAPVPDRVGLPIEVPPEVHGDADCIGPQTEKSTVPAGAPATLLPLTVTPSAVESPSWIVASAGVDTVVLSAWVTVKHSSPVPSLEDS